MKTLALLGSTGSIGKSTLDIVERFPHRFKVTGLSAGANIKLLIEQAKKFSPKVVSVAKPSDAQLVKAKLGPGVEVFSGHEGLNKVALESGADMLVSALVGAVGLVPTYGAIKAGMDVALANKETLVMAGELMLQAQKTGGSRLLPIDSEHSAIFQALEGRNRDFVKNIILTASGGPFRGKSAEFLKTITPHDALRHPNWSMGPKISIDSATMMNKGLEVIEACWLFDVAPSKIVVTIHPQSIVHSMVEFIDGSLLAQLGTPDMRGPISYALAYPERLALPDLSLNIWKMKDLTFQEPDMVTFPCLKLAFDAIAEGGTSPAVLSGANEVAVDAFLSGMISFVQIPQLVEHALNHAPKLKLTDIDTALDADKASRRLALEWIAKHGG